MFFDVSVLYRLPEVKSWEIEWAWWMQSEIIQNAHQVYWIPQDTLRTNNSDKRETDRNTACM